MPLPATSKTEFMRYLDANELAVKALRQHLPEYQHASHQSGKGEHAFGSWLRTRYAQEFNHAFINWWLKRPRLFGSMYATAPDL